MGSCSGAVFGSIFMPYEPRKDEKGHIITSLLVDYPIEDMSYEEQELLEEQMIVETV